MDNVHKWWLNCLDEGLIPTKRSFTEADDLNCFNSTLIKEHIFSAYKAWLKSSGPDYKKINENNDFWEFMRLLLGSYFVEKHGKVVNNTRKRVIQFPSLKEAH